MHHDDVFEGGEAACALPFLTDAGMVAEGVALIKLHERAAMPSTREKIFLITDDPITSGGEVELVPELVPKLGEDRTSYRKRLEEPLARTVAWKIALCTDKEVVHLVCDREHIENGYGADLVDYVRSLIG